MTADAGAAASTNALSKLQSNWTMPANIAVQLKQNNAKGAMNDGNNIQETCFPPPVISPETLSNSELYNTSGPNANNPSLSDIHQGDHGDCYFLAALGALVQHDPSAVKNMIRDNGNGTYTVTLYEKNTSAWDNPQAPAYTPKQITVNASDISAKGANVDLNHTVTDSSNGKLVIWPAVAEAAYAKMMAGYCAIGNGGPSSRGLAALTGHDVQDHLILTPEVLNQLQSQFKAGKLMTVATEGNIPTNPDGKSIYGLYGPHVYTVTGVYENDGKVYAKLNNPWGDRNTQPQDIPLSDLPPGLVAISVGTP